MKKAVSVIIPVYNGEGALERCLQGCLRQRGLWPGSYEVIVVDNASTDGTAGIIDRFSRRSELIRGAREERRSSYAARNRGIQVAKGRFLVFLDTDCIPSERWLRSYLRCARAMKDGGHDRFLIGGAVDVRLEDPDNAFEVFDRLTNLNQELFVTRKGFAATANLLVERGVIDEVGPFDPELTSGGDDEFGTRASAKFPLEYCPEAVVRHGARKTFRQFRKKSYRIAVGFPQVYRRKNGRAMPDRVILRQLIPNIGYLRPEYFPKLTLETVHTIPEGVGMRLRLMALDVLSRFYQFIGRCDGRAAERRRAGGDGSG